MENDIRMLIERRLTISNVSFSHLFDGQVFNHELIRKIFPMFTDEHLLVAGKSTPTLLLEANASACHKLTSSEAYQEFISIDENAEKYRKADSLLRLFKMTREDCYIFAKEVLPFEPQLHSGIDPRSEPFLKQLTISYLLNLLLYLLIENDPFIVVTWEPSSTIENQWFGKTMLLDYAASQGFHVGADCESGVFQCHTNEVNHQLLNQLRSPLQVSMLKKLSRRLFGFFG